MRLRNNKISNQNAVIPAREKKPVLAGLCAYMVVCGMVTTTPLFAERAILPNLDCVVEPSEVVMLGSAVPGQLAHTSFDKTDFVSAGDVMARLESSVERASLALAEEVARHATGVELRRASAAFGERTRERNARLVKTSSISNQAMDQVNTETEIAKLQVRQEIENKRLADLRVARERAALERRSIISPIHGTVVERFKSAGEYVDSEPVYEIAQLDPLHVEVIVPLEHLGKVESGMLGEVTLFAPGFENSTLNAVVRRIDAVSDAASATYGIRLELDNPDMTIPSGVRCQVSISAS
jgi:RND family efflux transporter MFP subunit